MEHVVCFLCCKTLKPDEEILMCGICEIWQHFKCTKGVSPSFYLQFYLSVMDDSAAPAYWSCPHCAQVEASEAKKTQESSLVLPEKGHSSHKLNTTFASTRTSREGPAPDPTPSLASLEITDTLTFLERIFKPYQLAITFEPANPVAPATVNKRRHEDLGDSSDDGIPAKVYKTSADFSFLCDSDSDDSLAIATLCAKLAEDSDLELDRAPNPDMPPSPVDPSITPLCHSSDKEECHVEAETTSDFTYSVSESTGKGTKSILTDSHGYTYQIKYKLGARVYWTCSEKKSRCHATVIQQRKDQFSQGAASHNHGSSQLQTSTGTDPTSEPDVSQSKNSTSQGPTSDPQTRTKTGPDSKPAVNHSQTSRIKGPTTEPAASQLMTRPTVDPTADPAVSQSDDGREKPATSQRKQLPKDQTLDQEDAGDKLPLGENLTSTKTSKPAKKVKSPAPAKKVKSTAPAKKVKSTAPAKKKVPVKAPPPILPLYSPPASPLICGSCNNQATFQEVSTCPRYGRKEKSYLLDPDYYIYKTKIEDEEKRTTTWKCTFLGDDGTKCPGMVTTDYLRQFNVDDHYYYDWTHNHNDHSRIRTQPHNHGPDKTTAIDLLVKANIHALIFGHKMLWTNTDDIINNAYDWLHDHEYLEAPSMHLRRYKRYIYTKKSEFKTDFGPFSKVYQIFTPWTDEEDNDEEEDTDEEEPTGEEVDEEGELTEEEYLSE